MKTIAGMLPNPNTLAAATLLACLAAPPAQAQYIMEFAQTYNAPTSNFINATFLNQQAMIDSVRPDARRAAPARLALGSAQIERSAAELAAAVPAAQREGLRKVYVQLMPSYRQIEHKLGWPKDDVAGAIAALVAGNYMAMTGTKLSDEVVSAAGNQLRASASIQQLLKKLGPAERRRLYEQSAMLGTFMAVAQMTSDKQPQEVQANLRHSARANLRLVLGEGADQVRFTPAGMRLE